MNSDLLKFNCPHCDARISAEPDQAGEASQCPVCSSLLVVPPAPSEGNGEPQLTGNSPPPLPQIPAVPPHPQPPQQPREAPTWLPKIVAQNPTLRNGIAKAGQTALRTHHLVIGVATLIAFLLVVCAIAFRPASPAGPWRGTVSAESRFDDEITRMKREYDDHIGEACRICGGSGLKPEYSQCSTCRGVGTVRTPSGYAMVCSDCSGSGLRRYRCTACDGTGRVQALR